MKKIILSCLIFLPFLIYGYTNLGYNSYREANELFIEQDYEKVLEICDRWIANPKSGHEDKVHFWVLYLATLKAMGELENYLIYKDFFEFYLSKSEEAKDEYNFFYGDDN